MKRTFNFKRKALWLFLAVLLSLQMQAQAQTITGKILDEGGLWLPGVSVLEKGTTNGTITDLDGVYTIDVASDSARLVFSFIGYSKQEISVNGKTKIDVTLLEDMVGLNEVVVIGYGTVKKSDATGSITAISSDDFNQGAITSAQELLIGKSAGVVITTKGGSPGGGSTIRIRGGSSLSASNDPLFVIDGVPVDNKDISGNSNILSTINPNDIETFTVLKDASATAIYGSRASNGVIIITTKRGKAGKPLSISYNGNISLSQPISFIDLMSGDEYRKLATEQFGTNNITDDALTRLGTENTDWQKEVFQPAVSHDHNISLTGSYKTMPYRVSYGYSDQGGILENTDMKRHTFSVGLDPSFFKNSLKIHVNAKGSYANNNFGNTDAVGAAVNFDPTKPIMNNNKRYGGYTAWTMNGEPDGEYNQMATSNPIAMANLTTNESDVYRGVGNIKFDYTFPFLKDLTASLNLGADYYKSEGINNADTTAVWTRRNGFGKRTDFSQEGKNQVIDFTLNYTKELDAIKSKIDIMGGYSWQHFWSKEANYERSIVDEAHPLIVADSSSTPTEYFLVSFFGRLNYSLMNRYLVTLTLRNDGSSRFSEDNRWGIFPSVALAWKINEEPFFKNVDQLSELKLRAGWGLTGQQAIVDQDYPYMGTYTISQPSAQYEFDGKYYPTLRPNAYDPNIKWETTTTLNLGLDFGFFDSRVTGSLEYYKRETMDLINEIAIPNGSNFSNYLITNVGTLENTGYEITLNGVAISKKDMSWDIGLTLSYNENKITKLIRTDDSDYIGVQAGDIGGGTGNKIQINSVGYPTNSFFVLEQVYDQSGMPVEELYVDKSGDKGNVSSNLDNYYRYKKPAADYLIGISTRFNYKKFDASVSARISIGNYVYNNRASQTFYSSMYTNNYWQNLSNTISDTKFNDAQYFSDVYIENASFFKLDNVGVGYSFNKLFSEKLRGRVSFTVQNVLTITKYDGLDPEVENGIDNNIYPRPRIYMLGFNLNF